MKIKDLYPNAMFLESAGEFQWMASHIFNPNSYPTSLVRNVEICNTKFALCLYYTRIVERAIEDSNASFLSVLKDWFDNRGLANSLVNRLANDCVATYDGLEYFAGYFSMAHSVKAFLDVYANLAVKLIMPSAQMKFTKGNYGGKKIAGGKFCSWLENSAPEYFNPSCMTKTISEHSDIWITRLVDHRDNLSHYNNIPGLVHMHARFANNSPCFDNTTILPPKMPDGQPMQQYCLEIYESLRKFIKDTLQLLPNVCFNALKFDFALPQLGR